MEIKKYIASTKDKWNDIKNSERIASLEKYGDKLKSSKYVSFTGEHWGKLRNKKLFVLFSLLLILNITAAPNKMASDYIDQALKRSATAYVAARGINAGVSLLQETEFSVSALIGSVSVSPGELLDPLNDLVERFSSVMLFATASLGIQKLLLEISKGPTIQILATLVLLILLCRLLVQHQMLAYIDKNKGFIYKLLICLLAIRFVVPFVAITNKAVDKVFIQEDMTENIEQLNKVKEIAMSSPPSEGKFTIKTFLKNTKNKISENAAKIKKITAQMEATISSITNLIALFVVQSVILPILFLFFGLKGAKLIYRHDFS